MGRGYERAALAPGPESARSGKTGFDASTMGRAMGVSAKRSAAALGAALLVCAWLVLERSEERVGAHAARGPGVEAEGDVREPLRARAEPPEQGNEREEQRAAAEHETPAALNARIQVFDGRSGAPLPGAVVRWLDIDDPAVVQALTAQALTAEKETDELVETIGGRALTDEGGFAGLPLSDPFIVHARHGRLWNEVVFPRLHEDPLRLELFPDLVVEVVDARGEPCAGVPLELWVREEDSARMARPTGPDGRAVFSHPDVAGRPRSVREVEVSFAFPLAVPVLLALRSDAIPEEPQRIELPPSGRVVVELLDLDGRPFAGAASVQLLAADDERAEETSRARPNAAGTVEFPHVGLGLELLCRATFEPSEPGSMGTTLESRASGPRTAGEATRMVLDLRAEHPVLLGRVLAADGRPLSFEQGSVCLRIGDEDEAWALFPPELSWVDGYPLGTDRDGRFQIQFSAGPVPPGERALVFHFPSRTAALRGSIQARIELSLALPSGVTELGDVVLGEPPFLASGRVVDDAGRPLAGAEVRILVRKRLEHMEPFWDGPSDLPSATTDAAGAFEVRGWIGEEEAEELGIAADLLGHAQPEPSLIAPGARELVLVLAELGVVAGALLLDPDLPLGCVTVTLYRDGAPRNRAREHQAQFPALRDAHASFHWPDIEPGALTLEVELASDPRSVLSLPIRVGAGGAPDPRLAGIDLRGLLRVVTLTVVDDAGAPIGDGWVQALDPRAEATAARWFDGGAPVRGGSVELVLTRAVDLALSAPRRRAQRLERVFEDRTVRLGAGPRVRLVLPDTLAIPEPPLVLSARLEPLDPGSRVKPSADPFAFEADGRATGWVDEPGSYALEWVAERRGPDGGGTGTVLLAPRQVLSVEDRVEEQAFELVLDATTLAQALARLTGSSPTPR